MSDPTPPVTPVTSSSASVAENYIDTELARARVTLQRTRLIGVTAVVIVAGYLGFVSSSLAASLQPKSAAEIAKGIIAEKVDTQANAIADDLKQRIPSMISQAPDYALQQIPQYREQLENKIEADLSEHMQTASAQIDQHLDSFLTAHKDEVKELLAHADDKATMDKLCEELQKEFMDSLKEAPANGESLQQKIDKSLAALKDIQKKMDRLANAKDLNPSEKKARRAVAILTQHIEEKRSEEGTPAVVPAAPGGV